MATVSEIRINDQMSDESPVIRGLNPIFTWEFNQDSVSQSQKAYEIRISLTNLNLGYDSFSGSTLTIISENTSNFYEYINHNLERGKNYYCQIRIQDQDGYWTNWTTFSFITNNLPFLTNAYLYPNSPSPGDEIEIFYQYNDIDQHIESGTKLKWFRNNVHIAKYDDFCILPTGVTSSGESWSAKIIPSDGLEFGKITETNSITIQSPSVSFNDISILPKNANVDDILKAEHSIETNEYLPISGEISYEWYVNEIAISDSNQQYIRLKLQPGDKVSVVVKISDENSIFVQGRSLPKTIQDVDWYVYDLEISGLKEALNLVDLEPVLEWKIHKTTAKFNEKPNYLKVLITKTPSTQNPIFDSGLIEYTKNSFHIPIGYLERGKKYYIHVGAGDSEIENYISKEVCMAGSSWQENADNNTGWSIETKLNLSADSTSESNLGMYIHDGKYFCSIIFGLNYVKFLSKNLIQYNFSSDTPPLLTSKTFRISGKNTDVKIFMDNKLIIDAQGSFTNASNLKFIEYGDVDPKNTNSGTFQFVRYSTKGAYGLDSNLDDDNTFLFNKIGELSGGSIENFFDNLISWLPDDTAESSKIIKFNENSENIRLSTANRNYSPITSIFIDKNRNKFIGTANGITAIYGEKHDPDYLLTINEDESEITSEDFDRISTVSSDYISNVENISNGWITVDTTFKAVPPINDSDIDEYNPYINNQKYHAIHYYSQRVPGHAWFDGADNEKGWRISFALDIEKIEADDYINENIDKHGFGVYINDGTYQEILYFYEDRIRLYYANVYVSINTKLERNYSIIGKGKNLFIYQKLKNSNSAEFLLLDGSGLFITPSSKTANSKKPAVIIDSSGNYHAVWQDDSNKRSQIFYSTNNGGKWSTPELITTSNQFQLNNPSIDIDSTNRIWVSYEDTSWGPREISVSVKDKAGWNPKTRITNYNSKKFNPSLKIDHDDNVHVVWEDDRNGNLSIFWSEWQNDKKAWISSGQFGSDTEIMSFSKDDPYLTENEYGQHVVDFKNPKLALLNNLLWIVCESYFSDTNESKIYRGFRNLTTKNWISSGSVLIENEELISTNIGFMTSLPSRYCINPKIATNEINNEVIVTWEDQTEPISQIWGAVFDVLNRTVTEPTKITNQSSNCKNQCVGWSGNNAIIVFIKDRGLYLSYFNSVLGEFFGSSTGGEDRIINISDAKSPENATIANYYPDQSFKILYDFIKDRDSSLVSSIESSEFYEIGDVLVEHISSLSYLTSTTTVSDNQVNTDDPKEFAFGDFSENVGIKAKWSNISMYFGYDARPYNIVKINSDSVENWPDNRVNDLFVDTFGNVIAATFAGLVYYNIYNNKITYIDGKTSSFDATNGCTDETCLLTNKVITTVKWGKNGIWYVGTTSGLFYSRTAGQLWEKLFPDIFNSKIISDIAIDKNGRAIVAAYESSTASNDGVFVAHPDMEAPISIVTPDFKIKCVEIDESDIIWAGSDSGLFRIENFSNKNILTFNKNNGMRSAHVNDITVVNKNLRYLATATGIEKMMGSQFQNINVHSNKIINNNISTVSWDNNTKSLWVGALYTLHEIVFRDEIHNIIENETIYYDHSEISTENNYDKNIYTVVDYNDIALLNDENNSLKFTSETSSVYINHNKINHGYAVNETSQSVQFLCDLLVNDQVDIDVTNKFLIYHDFNQSSIEKSVIGEKRSNIIKMDKTSRNQLLLLSGLDKPSILLDAGISSLPFATIMIDREPPVGCIEKLETVDRTVIKFRIIAYDDLSGLSGMILSNYENFTSDGENLLDYQQFSTTVDHNVGNELTNVITSLEFPATENINNVEWNIGYGTSLGKWFDANLNIEYLYAGTSAPAIIFRYNPILDNWSAISILDSSDTSRTINEIKNINNVLWVITGSNNSNGGIYKSVNGIDFELIGNITGAQVKGIASYKDGSVFFGSSDGKIYQYKDNLLSIKYQNIGQSVYSISIFGDTLLASTGNNGRIFTIDLTNDNNLIIFDGSENYIKQVFVKDSDIISSPDQAVIYASSGEYTTIYKAKFSDFGFSKSFNSYGSEINKIIGIDSITLLDPEDRDGVSGTSVISAIGSKIFKHNNPGWEFIYNNNDVINDMIQYSSNGVEGIWIISENKVKKWTANRNKKTIYLRLKDKAGNTSRQPDVGDEYICPTEENTICCGYSYSINIKDLQGFINESRIIDVSEYGTVNFSYDSPNDRSFFGADRIDIETGIYSSDVFNGSNDLVSWKSITWNSVEPENTNIYVQIRSAVTEDEINNAEWSNNLVKNSSNLVSLEHITDQYLQFRVILTSHARDISPTLSSVTLRNLTSQASHFFTTNFVLPSRPIKGLLTANSFIPVSADIIFGINTKNSVDFGDYQLIEPNRLFTTTRQQFGTNLRIGAKLLSPNVPQVSRTNDPGDPYDSSSYLCNIEFNQTNSTVFDVDYHFRIRFYNDRFRTQLIYTFFTGNSQTGWSTDGIENSFPSNGYTILSGETKTITFDPADEIDTDQKWYITIDSYDGANFETLVDNKSFVCSPCNIVNEQGLIGQYYGGFATLNSIPDFSSLTPQYTVIDSDINFPAILTAWVTTDGTILNSDFVNRFAIQWKGKILIPSTGEYEFKIVSDDGSILLIDATEIINFDGIHDEVEKTELVNLEQGFHDINLQYFAALGPAYCQLYWKLPGETSFSTVPATNFYHSTTTEYCDGNEPKILNLAMIFELENGETVKVNL